jgi:hypothetical protein
MKPERALCSPAAVAEDSVLMDAPGRAQSVQHGKHGPSPTFIAEVAARNASLAAYAALCHPNLTPNAAAQLVRAALLSYRASNARERERSETEVPNRWRGKAQAYLWMVLQARDTVPAVDTIRKILEAAY